MRFTQLERLCRPIAQTDSPGKLRAYRTWVTPLDSWPWTALSPLIQSTIWCEILEHDYMMTR
jgi:hypothetical protein